MPSSRYRDDRNEGRYPPRHGFPPRDYYPPSSSSHPYDSRPPQYSNSSAYPPPPSDSNTRFAPVGGSRGYEDRGYPNHSHGGGGGSSHAGSSRHDERRDRYAERGGNGRDSKGGDFRARSPPPSSRGAGKAREDDRNRALPDSDRPSTSTAAATKSRHSNDPRASLHSSYRDLSPPTSATLPVRDDAPSSFVPPPKVTKGSYERSSKHAGATPSPAVAPSHLPQSSPGMEPGEVMSPPKGSAVDLPPVQASKNAGASRGGDDRDRSRAGPTWARHSATSASNAAPRSYPPVDSSDSRASSSRRGASPRRYGLPASRGQSPPRRFEKAQHTVSVRRLRSPDSTNRRRSVSPPPRSQTRTKPEPAHRRGRSPTRSPRSPSRSPSISPPPKTRRRRRGSSCSSVSRSPSPPPAVRRKPAKEGTTRHTERGRSISRSPRSPSGSSARSYSRSRSTSPRTARGRTRAEPRYGNGKSTSMKLDKRPRSPDAKGSERSYDKKAKVSNNAARPFETVDSNSPSLGQITNSTTSSQRATLPANPTHHVPLASYSSPSSAPTGPRALRPLLPDHLPAPPSSGLLPLSGGRVTVNVPPGPKPKAGFAPIKTTQVAGPPTVGPSVTPVAQPAPAKAGGIKKFFPGEEEEEEERQRVKERKAKEERDESDRLARELEDRMKSERARDRTSSRYAAPKKTDRMDVDDDRFAPNSTHGQTRRDRRRSPSPIRSRSRSVMSSRSRTRSRSRSRSRSPSRERNGRRRNSSSRDGWVVRNGGDVPPPRTRPFNDDDIDSGIGGRQYFQTRPGHASVNTPGYGPRRYDNSASAHRTPASYERPSHSSFGGARNGFNANVTSANAVVPGVVERKWGTPAARPLTDPPVADRTSVVDAEPASSTVSHRLEETARASNGSGWTKAPTGPSGPTEAGTPPLGAKQPLPLDPPSLSRPDAAKPASPLTPSSEPAVAAPVAASGPPSAAPTPAPEPVVPAAASGPSAAPTEFYERIVQVGEGTYGKVYKARNVETGGLVALKRIRMEAEKDGFPVTAVREIKLLQNLRHPNVVDLAEMLVSKGHVYMVMEYMDHDLTGILHHPTVSFSPAHLKSLMKQFLDGLGFIHRRGVLHRDLKGSNILLSRSGELKIADFGLARFFARGRNNDYTNRVITQWYKPPELLFGATVYGEEVDMWSAGCIFLELFARRPVFQGQDEIHQLEVIFKVTGTPTLENWPGAHELPWYELVKPKTALASQLRSVFSKWISPAGLDVAERLLSLDPAGRPTAAEALQMEYFVSEEPKPELPDFLSTLNGSWHEFESKRARRKAREEAA